jgi:hypothetical protein
MVSWARLTQPAALSSRATLWTSSAVHLALGLRSVGCSSAQSKPEATSAAVYCQTERLVPDRRSMKKSLRLHLLAGLCGVDVRLGRRAVGFALVGVRVAGDQRAALGARVEHNPLGDPPDAALRSPDPALLSAPSSAEIRLAPKSGVGEREGDQALLQMRADLVRASAGGGAPLTGSASSPQRSTRRYKR